jgi:hypothetical protein
VFIRALTQIKGEDMTTPCEELGYKVGDLFVATDEGYTTSGYNVVLSVDDGSEYPMFVKELVYARDVKCDRKDFDYNDFDFLHLSVVRKLEETPEVKLATFTVESSIAIQQIKELTEALKELEVAYSKVSHIVTFEGE